MLIYGAAALGEVTQDVADRSVQEALDAGINHFDVAASYGEAELRLGPLDALGSGTRSSSRPRPATATPRAPGASINTSLERLQTDHVDLLQLHAIGDLDELDLVTGKGGALEAALRAQDEGLVGAVGITGHGDGAPATHLEALRRHPFATVLTPMNVVLTATPPSARAYEELADEVARQDAGLMLIKTVARQNWQRGQEHRYATWYEPFDDQRTHHGRHLVGVVAARGDRARDAGRRRSARHGRRGRAVAHRPGRGRRGCSAPSRPTARRSSTWTRLSQL